MGYNVFITRAREPDLSNQHPIPEADWISLLQSDSSLKVSSTDYYERRNPDGRTERFQMVVWTEHAGCPAFMLIDGAVQIKSPDEATIRKMVEMAAKLGARVVGEEGEVYPSACSSPSPPLRPANFFVSWPIWKLLLIGFLAGCILLALKLLIFGS